MKSMAAPKTRSLKLKLRTTNKEVDAEIKLLPPSQLVEIFRRAGIKTVKELSRMRDLSDLKMMSIVEQVCVEAVSVTERWTVDEVRNTFDLPELMKIYLAVVESIPWGSTNVVDSSRLKLSQYG
jgi:hypothetical protein